MAQHIHKAMNAEVRDLLATGSKYLDVRYVQYHTAEPFCSLGPVRNSSLTHGVVASGQGQWGRSVQ